MKTYQTLIGASCAWLRRAKRLGGLVEVRGGGWWKLTLPGCRRRVQGHHQMAPYLRMHGEIIQNEDGTFKLKDLEGGAK